LIEKTDSKQHALQELNSAEQNKPPFDEQFIIFRYRKIIEDEIAESKNDGNVGLDVVSEIAFQNHMRQCQANIEKSSILHMEFWSQLSEDNPDLNKLNELGVKIHHSVNNVEDHWQKLQKISPNMPKAMKLYGKFLSDILNDKDRGEEYLEKARNLVNINANKKINGVNFTGNEDIGDTSVATIVVTSDPEKLGIITSINLACSSVFGYTKSELINRNIKIMMPQIYAKNHDKFLEAYNATQEMKFIDKERFIFGKHKSYYVFPVFANIKPLNTGQNTQFVGTFRIDKFFKNTAYFITHGNGLIDSISSSNFLLTSLHFLTEHRFGGHKEVQQH
jgi:PAS domain S-box-containing protein